MICWWPKRGSGSSLSVTVLQSQETMFCVWGKVENTHEEITPRTIFFNSREENKVSHYIINKVQKGKKNNFRIGDQSFTDLATLLNFYKSHYLDTTPLIRAAVKKMEKVVGRYDFEGSVSNNSLHLWKMLLFRLSKKIMSHITEPNQILIIWFCPFKDPDDLPFRKGEILTIISKDEENWWTARNIQGQTGSIPVPYVSKVRLSTSITFYFI